MSLRRPSVGARLRNSAELSLVALLVAPVALLWMHFVCGEPDLDD